MRMAMECDLGSTFENWNVVGASASQYIMSLGSMGLQRRCFPRTTRLRVLQMDNWKTNSSERKVYS